MPKNKVNSPVFVYNDSHLRIFETSIEWLQHMTSSEILSRVYIQCHQMEMSHFP